MQKTKIFISSVQSEFAEERAALALHIQEDALLSQFFEVFLFESLPALDASPPQVYLAEVAAADVYLGLLGSDYGYEDQTGISPTEQEYDAASAHHKERWIYIKGDSNLHRHNKQKAFITKVGAAVSRKRYDTMEDLQKEVSASCVRYLQDKGYISHIPFDLRITDLAIDTLAPQNLQWFIRKAKSKRGFPLDETAELPVALAHMGLLESERISNAAILLFSDDASKYYPQAIVKCASYHGLRIEKPAPDHKVFSGTLFDQIDQAIDFVLAKIAVTVGKRTSGAEAPVSYEIPREVIAEAIVNAVAHRDYNSNGSVQVYVFSDRIEISNPGRLTPELDIEDLKKEHTSFPTNTRIAECLYQTGYIERLGTGTLDMMHAMEETDLPEPRFLLDSNFTVILYRKDIDAEEATKEVTEEATEEVTEEAGAVVVADLVKRLVLVMNGEMKRKEIQALLDINHDEHFRSAYMIPAIEQQYLEMKYPDKPKHPKQQYRLTTKGIELKKILQDG